MGFCWSFAGGSVFAEAFFPPQKTAEPMQYGGIDGHTQASGVRFRIEGFGFSSDASTQERS